MDKIQGREIDTAEGPAYMNTFYTKEMVIIYSSLARDYYEYTECFHEEYPPYKKVKPEQKNDYNESVKYLEEIKVIMGKIRKTLDNAGHDVSYIDNMF